jgi:signal transduction histidine kinase
VRYRLELKAAALLHDTVLSHLAAIAGSPSEVLDPSLRKQMSRDLEILVGQEWLDPASPSIDLGAGRAWQGSELNAAIVGCQRLGLDVRVTGDLSLVGRLNPASAAAVGLAVRQCLVNVLKHSGRSEAEVAIYGTDAELSIMVVDEGRGFVEAATASDRLGLRTSVRGRIESLGGSVQIFSTLGRGTSVTIRVPIVSALSVESADPVRP